MAVPADAAVELLLVDNGSTDDTETVVRSSTLNGLKLKYLHEPRPGKGYAYNSAIARAAGDVMLFTDDDIRPSQTWIECMCRPIQMGITDGVQGDVIIASHLERAIRLDGLRRGMVASVHVTPFKPHPILVGANMAISRRVFESIPEFDIELGPGALGFGDDTLLALQMLKAGYRIIGAAGGEVFHHFDAARLGEREFLSTARRMGASSAYLDYHWQHKDLPFLRIQTLLAQAKTVLRSRLSNIGSNTPSPEWRLYYEMKLGYLEQFRKLRRQPRKYDKYGLKRRT